MQDQQILNQMIDLSQKKLEMLTELKQHSESQNEAIKQGDFDRIEKMLNKKEELIQSIQKLDSDFLLFSDNLKKLLGIKGLDELSSTTLEGRAQLKDHIEKITSVVESIIRIEQSGYENASAIRNELAERIKGVNAGRKMTSAYHAKPISNPSYFFDKKK
jgi:hypothetical protein